MFSSTTGLPATAPTLVPMDEPVEQVNTRPAPKLPSYDQYLSLDIQNQLNRAEVNKAVDIRYPTTAFLQINSADRYPPGFDRYLNPSNTTDISGSISNFGLTSPYDFTIPTNQSVMNGKFTRIGLTQFFMDWTYPLISAKTDGLYITYRPSSTNIATTYLVKAGQAAYGVYGTAATILTSYLTVIRTLTGNAGFTWAVSGNFATNWSSTATTGAAVNDEFYFSKWVNPAYPRAKTTFDILGLNSSQQFSNFQVSAMTASLWPTTYVDVVCEPITANQQLRDSSTSPMGRTLLARIYTTSENTTLFQIATAGLNSSSFISKTFPVPKWISWPGNQPISQLRFQLLDDTGTVMTCGPNYGIGSVTWASGTSMPPWTDINMGDWSCVLQVSEL